MNTQTRLALDDTVMTSIIKMAGGNPGALRVCTDIVKHGQDIDPHGMGGLGALIFLDALGIYGSRIWILFKDVCGEDLVKTMACLRSWQLGITPEQELQSAIDGVGNIDTNAILASVQENSRVS